MNPAFRSSRSPCADIESIHWQAAHRMRTSLFELQSALAWTRTSRKHFSLTAHLPDQLPSFSSTLPQFLLRSATMAHNYHVLDIKQLQAEVYRRSHLPSSKQECTRVRSWGVEGISCKMRVAMCYSSVVQPRMSADPEGTRSQISLPLPRPSCGDQEHGV